MAAGSAFASYVLRHCRPWGHASRRAFGRLKARLADLGYVTFTSTPAEFGKLIAQETEKWGKVLKFAGVKPE
jgi:hypothetical protein